MNKKFKKSISSFLIFIVFLTPFLSIPSRQANAQFGIPTPTAEIPGPLLAVDISSSISNMISAGSNVAHTLKETAGDGFAYIALNMVIERLAASTVKWINSGFKGSPGFIQDPESYFMDLGDKIAGDFISRDPNLQKLCGPISLQVRLALTSSYTREQQWQCTLTNAKGNLEDFMGDFSRGGWDNFFEVTQKPQNNPIGAYLQAQNELSLRLSSAQESKKMELQWGTGFLSKKECVDWSDPIETEYDYDDEGNLIDSPQTLSPQCINEKTSTPGSVIEEQLNDVLGLGTGKLEAADEINEIISSLLNQLTSKAIGAVGKGLSSLSSPDTSNGGRVFIDELSTTSKQDLINEYFEKTEENLNQGLQTTPPDVTFCHNNPYAPECLPGEPTSPAAPQGICITNPSDPSCQIQP